MYEVSRALPHVGVSIRHVYNAATFQQVTRFTDLYDGVNLVATGTEPLQLIEYPIIKKEDLEKNLHNLPNPYTEVGMNSNESMGRNRLLSHSIQTETLATWDSLSQ